MDRKFAAALQRTPSLSSVQSLSPSLDGSNPPGSKFSSQFSPSYLNALRTSSGEEAVKSLKMELRIAMEERAAKSRANTLYVKPSHSLFVPHPAPGHNVEALRAVIAREPSVGAQVNTSIKPMNLSAFLPPILGHSTEFIAGEEWGVDFSEIETPRTVWRKQYWGKGAKRPPWAIDRRCFSGTAAYITTTKPNARNYNSIGRWEYGKDPWLSKTSEDLVRQIVVKLEQRCNSSFSLNRQFKFLDRDSSGSIDVQEMRAMLTTFSIEMSEHVSATSNVM